MIDNDWPYPKGFMKSGYLEPSKKMFDFWHFFGSRCSPGLWRLREHTWTINGKFQKVDAVWGFGFETTGHMWTINWGTISMWPWSREKGLERSGGSRDCNGFLATRTRRRLAARCRCTAAQLGQLRQPDRCIFIWVQYIWYLIYATQCLLFSGEKLFIIPCSKVY